MATMKMDDGFSAVPDRAEIEKLANLVKKGLRDSTVCITIIGLSCPVFLTKMYQVLTFEE